MTQNLHTTLAATVSLTLLIAALACGGPEQEDQAVTAARAWVRIGPNNSILCLEVHP